MIDNARKFSRRSFLKAGVGTTAMLEMSAMPIVAGGNQDAPGKSARKVKLAAIGTGSMAKQDLQNMLDEEFVAFCDVDERSLQWVREKFPKAKIYKDYHVMLKEVHELIDAVTVIVPDHIHAPAALEAMKYGKAVFCEKPMAHSVAECRAMRTMAKAKNIITQVGNQGHASEHMRIFKEWVLDGAIGRVKEVHVWCDMMQWLYYHKPAELDLHPPVPAELDWNLWQGAVPEHAYLENCVPQKWRGWRMYGSGALGDWVCHMFDPIFWTFELDMPVAVTAEIDGYDGPASEFIYPKGSKITWEFIVKSSGEPLKIHWYDGTIKVPRPADLEPERKLDIAGVYVVGDKGTILHGAHGAGSCRIIPESKMQAYKRPPKTLSRCQVGHYKEWLNAVREGVHSTGSPFEYGGRLTEAGLLGLVAQRFPGRRLIYSEAEMRFTNCEEANKWLYPVMREDRKFM
ncbi:MAG: Gfo/Idh/MocA family oxidoreductase [bacterium]